MNSNFTLKKIIVVIFGIIMFYVLFAIYSDIEKLKENYQQINLVYLFPIILILSCTLFFRGLIQKFLLKQIGIEISIKQSFLLFLAGLSMIVTPGGSGQMIKSYFLKEQHGYPISKSLPLVYAERFHDLLAVSILVVITFFSIFSIESLIACLISFSLVVVLILISKNRGFFKKLISLLNKIKFLQSILPDDSQFNNSLQLLFKKSVIIKVAAFTLAVTILEGLIVYMGFLSFDVNLGYFQSVQLFYTAIIFGVLSFIPGGVGVVEGGFTVLLTRLDISLAIAASLIIFIRLTTIWIVTGVGFISAYVIHKK